MKLNQVIAIANGEKSKTQKTITKVYQNLKKETLFEGITKRYTPKFEDGEIYPNEDKQVQQTVEKLIGVVKKSMSEMFNVVATQDVGNCDAGASIVVDEVIVAEDVPVTHLLFLEKQMIDIRTLVESLPVLDPADKWSHSPESFCYKSEAKDNFRTKKIPKNHVVSEATKEHPAQVQVFTEDVIEGTWTTVKFSGNIPQTEKNDILERIDKMIKAIKIAREEGNSIEVERSEIGSNVLDYIFKD
jgi:hypothetical protein